MVIRRGIRASKVEEEKITSRLHYDRCVLRVKPRRQKIFHARLLYVAARDVSRERVAEKRFLRQVLDKKRRGCVV
jgi:hypothetical protein